MKFALAAAATLVLAGCATTENTQLASAECKVVPMTTGSYTGVRKPDATSSVRMADAEAQLATSSYRMSTLARHGLAMNNVEDALRDCSLAQ